jgi:citrate synthase
MTTAEGVAADGQGTALSWGTGMPPDTGRTIFAVARVAGWAAHYMEELTERPLRFRARAVYSV